MSVQPCDLFAAAASGAGWQARLELRFRSLQGRTRLVLRRHEGPLLVQRAFYPEGPLAAAASEPCHVYVIHPPGGVVGGDELQLSVEVEPQAHALLTSCAAGKFYRRGGERVARLTQTLRVDDGLLEWLPQENIFYPGAAVELRTRVQLHGAARFIGWELGCLGLPANGLSLGDGIVRQSLELWRDGTPLLLERVRLSADALTARWGLAGHAVLGSWIAYPATQETLLLARAALAGMNCADATLACTLLDGVLCCRAVAQRADWLKQAFVDLWCALRPVLLGRPAIAPRIWAT